MAQPTESNVSLPPEFGDTRALDEASRLIAAHPPGSAECRRGLELLRSLAEGAAAPLAMWLLGAWHLQATAEAGAHAEAARWLRRAADAGVPPAIDRLANLHLRGLGVPFDPAVAIALLRRLADTGYQAAAWSLAYLLGRHPQAAAGANAATAFARACALAYPPAYYSLGLRFAAPGPAHDAGFARALLLRAADAGFPDAQAAAGAPAAAGASAGADAWYKALRENVEAARPVLRQLQYEDPVIDAGKEVLVRRLEAHFATLAHPALHLGADGRLEAAGLAEPELSADPGAWNWLASDPRVGVCRGFATREECAHLRYLSAEDLADPAAYSRDTRNGAFETAHFNGRARLFGALHSDAVIRTVEARIARHAGCDIAAIEPCSVVVYGPGQSYDTHVDFFSAAQLAANRERWNDSSGQRIATFLLCLHAAEAGGGTSYPHAALTVQYETGTAAMHYNVTPDGRADPHSVHRGLPVERGEKWLLRTTLRERSRYASVPPSPA